MYLWRLLVRSLEGASLIAMGIAIVLGIVTGLAFSRVWRLTPDDLTNLGAWALVGGAGAFTLFLVFIAPYLLYRDERKARLKAENKEQPYIIENTGEFAGAHIERLEQTFYVADPSGRVVSGSNILLVSQEREALVFPRGDITVRPGTARIEVKAFAPTIEITENPPEEPQSRTSSTRDPKDPPPSRE